MVVFTHDSAETLVGANADVIDGMVVRLFKNDVTPTAGSVGADFTEADFTGYAAADPLEKGAPFIGSDGQWKTQFQRLQWDHDGGPNANTVYGWYVMSTGGTPQLLAAERFAEPKPMSAQPDAISLVIEIKGLPTGSSYQVG